MEEKKEDIRDQVCHNIISARLKRNITQKNLAEKIGMNEIKMTRYELGTQELRRSNISKISNALNLTAQEMIDIFFYDFNPKKTKQDIMLDAKRKKSVCNTCTHRHEYEKYFNT